MSLSYLVEDDAAVDDRIQAIEDELDALHIGVRSEYFPSSNRQFSNDKIDHADLMYRMISRTPDPAIASARSVTPPPSSLALRSQKLREELLAAKVLPVDSREVDFARQEVEELNEFMVEISRTNEIDKMRLKERIAELEQTILKNSQNFDSLRKEILQLTKQKTDAEEAVHVLESTISDFENQRLADAKLISELRREFKMLSDQSQRTIDSLKEKKSAVPWESDWTPNINLYATKAEVRNYSPSPPWALHEGDAAPVTPQAKVAGLIVNDLKKESLTALKRDSPISSESEAKLESALLEYNLEKIDLEAFLARIPPNSSGRTLNERREKFLQEKRLTEINGEIVRIRRILKQGKLDRKNPN